MRIRIKLLLTYMALIGLITLLAGIGLPQWVEGAVIEAEHGRLHEQAQRIADNLSVRIRSRRLDGAQAFLTLVESLLVDETAFVDDKGVVVRATRPELMNKQIPNWQQIVTGTDRPRFPGRRLTSIPGAGQYLIAAAPLQGDVIKGYHVVMIRDIRFISDLAHPITRRLTVIVGVVLLAALVVSGWLSREMVGRLQATGAAARALAEGDLTQRARVGGKDEIAELAGHFNHMAQRIEKLVEGLRKSEGLRKELLVTVSHELRTPMTSIAGFAEALRDGVVRDEAQKQRYYSIIASESARLNRLINDVFAMARLEAGQAEIRLQEMHVAAWLMEVADGFLPVAESAGVRLELEISPEAERAGVYGDRDRLDQVIGNLLSNAFRFTPAGEPATIRARVDRDDVVFEVTDRGPGLAPEDAQRVFERFFQGTDRGKGHTGAGLGLSIVKSLVEAHGGTVGVESEPGHGSTFWFRLKRLEE